MPTITAKDRIVLVLIQFPKLSESFIVNKFLGLLASGFDVHIVCKRRSASDWQHFPQLTPDLRNRVHEIWPRHNMALVLLLLPLALIWCLDKNPAGTVNYLKMGWQEKRWAVFRQFYQDATIIGLHPDLVHFSFGTLAVDQPHLKSWLGTRLSASFRGYDLNFVGLDTPSFYDDLWMHADGLHFLGNDLRRRALRRGCPDEIPFALIPPAINTQLFTPGHSSEHDNKVLRILSIGRLEWKKGYEYALLAIRKLVDEDQSVIYHIIGDGNYRGPLMFLVHQHGLQEQVKFLGALPHAEIVNQLQWADAFLHAAVSEGFSNAVMEAQAMELPIVCTDADGLSENVSHGETGFVVPRRNPEALAEKLLLLANDPELRGQMGRAGRLRVQSHFQLADQNSAFSEFFSRILSR